MIYIWTGKNGSGKTFDMVARAHQAWKDGAHIYSNIFPLFFSPQHERITYYSSLPEIYNAKEGVILMDEGQEFCSCRDWQNLPAYFSAALTQHRKNKLDIYVSTQDFSFVDKRIRKLAEQMIFCERVFRWPLENPEKGSRQETIFQLTKKNYCDIMTLEDGRDIISSYKSRYLLISKKNFLFIKASPRLYDTYSPVALHPFKCFGEWAKNKIKVKFQTLLR